MNKKQVLVLGDIMIDRYTYVTSSRIAQEAPVPVWDVVKVEKRFGGAANVALNLVALAGDEMDVYLAGITTRDVCFTLENLSVDMSRCVTDTDDVAMTKDRIVDERSQKILARIDNFKQFSPHDAGDVSFMINPSLFDAVIVSDYDKGTITEKIVRLLDPVALKVVDSKRKDMKMFQGFDVLKVNKSEYAAQFPFVDKHPTSLFRYVVETLGSAGACLHQYDEAKTKQLDADPKNHCSFKIPTSLHVVHSEMFAVEAIEAVDVTGCGDTHTAAMTIALLRGRDMRDAVRYANACARAKVAKFGTSVVKPTDVT